jgi:FixJ family two-component response regulator
MAQDIEGTVYSVDRDRVTQARLTQLLGARGINVKSFCSAESFFAECLGEVDHARDAPAFQPACLVLEVSLPDMSGFDLQAALASRHSTLPLVFLAATTDPRVPIRALRAGAVDFLLKPMEPAALVASVREALALDNRCHEVRSRRTRIVSRMEELTQRETEVMAHVVRGHTSKEIAQALCISPRTVEVHRKNLFSKMRADSVACLVEQVIEARATVAAGSAASASISADLRDITYLTRAGNV